MTHLIHQKEPSICMPTMKEIIREKLLHNEPIIVVMKGYHSPMIVQDFAQFNPEELGLSPLYTHPIVIDDIVLCKDEMGKFYRFKIDDLEIVNI